jgi:hypothetical protein
MVEGYSLEEALVLHKIFTKLYNNMTKGTWDDIQKTPLCMMKSLKKEGSHKYSL